MSLPFVVTRTQSHSRYCTTIHQPIASAHISSTCTSGRNKSLVCLFVSLHTVVLLLPRNRRKRDDVARVAGVVAGLVCQLQGQAEASCIDELSDGLWTNLALVGVKFGVAVQLVWVGSSRLVFVDN